MVSNLFIQGMGCNFSIFFAVNKSVRNRLNELLRCTFFFFQRSLSNTEDECTHLKEMNERTQEELQELANKYNGAVNEIKDLTDKLKVLTSFQNSYFSTEIWDGYACFI